MSELINIDMFYLFSAPLSLIILESRMPRGKICQYTTPTSRGGHWDRTRFIFPILVCVHLNLSICPPSLINRVINRGSWQKVNVSSAMTKLRPASGWNCVWETQDCRGDPEFVTHAWNWIFAETETVFLECKGQSLISGRYKTWYRSTWDHVCDLAEIRVILDIPISTQPTLVLKHSQAKMARKPIKIGILG